MTRALVLALAAFYALQATWILHAGFDALFPRVAAVVSPDSCCASACGCPEDIRRRGDCCCDPSAKPDAPRTVTASAFDVARCSGLELAMAQALALPALAEFPRLDLPLPRQGLLALPVEAPDVDAPPAPLDKVPL